MIGSVCDRRWSALPARAVRADGTGNRWWTAIVLAIAILLAPASRGDAQTQGPGPTPPNKSRHDLVPPWRMTVRADNDAFNFWRSIDDRPDRE